MNFSPAKKYFPAAALLWALLFFFILWRSDFPKPTADDLFQIGASLNLAQSGELFNPLIARQNFPGHLYFIYPPLHTYTLDAWWRIFGISAASATAFPILMYFIITAGTVAILRKYAAPAWLDWLVPLGVTIAFLPAGLRPEPFAGALAMWGFALIECGNRRTLPVFFGFLLLFLGASAAPRLTPLPTALAGLACWRLWPARHATDPRRWHFLIAAVVACALAWLSFLLMIHFKLREFLSVFGYVAAGRTDPKLEMLKSFLATQRITIWPLWALFFTLLILAIRRPKNPLNQLALLSACLFPVEILIANLEPHIMWYMILPLFLITASCWQAKVPQRTILAAALVLFLGLANVKTLINIIGIQTGKISLSPGEQFDQAFALRPTAEHPLLITGAAARYLHGYRLPPGFLDYDFSAPFPLTHTATTNLRPGDIYLLGTSSMEGIERFTYLPHQPRPKWNPFHVDLLSFDQYPRHIYLIPEEACQGLRIAPTKANQ